MLLTATWACGPSLQITNGDLMVALEENSGDHQIQFDYSSGDHVYS